MTDILSIDDAVIKAIDDLNAKTAFIESVAVPVNNLPCCGAIHSMHPCKFGESLLFCFQYCNIVTHTKSIKTVSGAGNAGDGQTNWGRPQSSLYQDDYTTCPTILQLIFERWGLLCQNAGSVSTRSQRALRSAQCAAPVRGLHRTSGAREGTELAQSISVRIRHGLLS